MKRDRNHRYLDRITDEASDWFVRLQDSAPGAEEQSDFAEWLAASPNNVREYLQVAALWEDLHDLGPDPQIDELVRAALASHDENVVAFSESPTEDLTPAGDATAASGPRRRRFRPIATAAAVGLVVLTLGWLWWSAGPADYRTAVGEQKSFALSDGSVVTLNTRSEIRVRYTNTHRDIVLVGGEALFDVAKDHDRPFRVLADGAVIRAIGTQFNVRNRNHDTTVTVLEGTVEVVLTDVSPDASLNDSIALDSGSTGLPDSVELTVGQMARVDRRSGQLAVASADIEHATAWRERRLVFESRSLRDVVDEFNLYNEPPMVIGDPTLEVLQISGAFNANDRESFVLFLEETGIATAQTDPDGRTALRRNPGAVE
jgi:transmembrane sensor